MMRRRAAVVAVAIAVGSAASTGCAGDTGDSGVDAPATDRPTAPTSVSSATSSVNEPTTAASITDTSSPAASAADTTSATSESTSTAAPPARVDSNLDADAIAERLSTAHATMIDTSADGDDRERAGVDYQLVLRELTDRAELDDQVLAALAPPARAATERIVRARQFLQERSASLPPQPIPNELPAWTVVEPEPADALLALYADAELRTGIPWYWLAAIHLQETRMGRIQGVSSAGAVGPMQFLPTTWAGCCTGDPTVTSDAVLGAATYLALSGGPDDMAAALFEYNPNDGYVAVVTAYATSLRDQPELYTGFHAFQVFFATSAGTVRLPVGYSEAAPIDAAGYLASHPHDAG